MALELGVDPAVVLRLKPIQKIGVGGGLLALVAIGYWWLFFGGRMEEIDKLEKEIKEQEDQISQKERMLKEMPKLKAELANVEKKETEARAKLPSSKDIPDLLSNISLTGRQFGLTFLSFDPGAESPADFYTTVPVQLTFTGLFNEIGHFLEKVSRFERIVNINEFDLATGNAGSERETMVLGGVSQDRESLRLLTAKSQAVTYRYIEDDPASKGGKDDGSDKKKKGKKK